jgi:hypothetical protein
MLNLSVGDEIMKQYRKTISDNCEIYESRVRLAILSIGCILLSLGGLFMFGATLGVCLGLLGTMKSGDFPYLVFAMLMGVAAVVLFGSGSFQMVRRLLGASAPVVFLAEDGFTDVRVSATRIPWQAILSVKDPRGGKGSRGFVVEIEPKFAAKLALSFASRVVQLGNRLFGFKGVWVVTFTLKGVSAGTLFDAMRDRINRVSVASMVRVER